MGRRTIRRAWLTDPDTDGTNRPQWVRAQPWAASWENPGRAAAPHKFWSRAGRVRDEAVGCDAAYLGVELLL